MQQQQDKAISVNTETLPRHEYFLLDTYVQIQYIWTRTLTGVRLTCKHTIESHYCPVLQDFDKTIILKKADIIRKCSDPILTANES